MKRNELSEVEQRVLLFIFMNEKVTMSELIDGTRTSPNSVKHAVERLIDLGLVAEMREKTFPHRRFLFLTEKGRAFARALHEAYRLLSR